jgi:hypothetical protein
VVQRQAGFVAGGFDAEDDHENSLILHLATGVTTIHRLSILQPDIVLDHE